ncbi:hypothetical protein Trydic_g17995 [Trypoxylus dichotomus]
MDHPPRRTTSRLYVGRVLAKVEPFLSWFREANDYKSHIQTHATITLQLRSEKDLRDPLTSTGVYRIPCGLVHIGSTKRSIKVRVKWHKRKCSLGQTNKSAVAEHALEDGDHNIDFANTEVLSTVSPCHIRLQGEAMEIYKYPTEISTGKKTILHSTRFSTRICETRQPHIPLREPTSEGYITAACQTTNHSTLRHRDDENF